MRVFVTTIIIPHPLGGMVPSCLRVRLMVRLLVSVLCMRLIVPRVRMRALGSACAVGETPRLQ